MHRGGKTSAVCVFGLSFEVSNGRDTISRTRLTLPSWLEGGCALVLSTLTLLRTRSLPAPAADPVRQRTCSSCTASRTVASSIRSRTSAAIRSRVNSPVNFYVHYLEAQGLEDANYDHSLSENLRSELSGVKLDVVITAVYSSYQFALRHRDELFPGVPIIFSYVHASRVDGKQLPPGVTGVTVSVGIRETLELAFKLHPGTENLAVVAGSSEFGRDFGGLQFATSSVRMQKGDADRDRRSRETPIFSSKSPPSLPTQWFCSSSCPGIRRSPKLGCMTR